MRSHKKFLEDPFAGFYIANSFIEARMEFVKNFKMIKTKEIRMDQIKKVRFKPFSLPLCP
jgi:hypothetical protein